MPRGVSALTSMNKWQLTSVGEPKGTYRSMEIALEFVKQLLKLAITPSYHDRPRRNARMFPPDGSCEAFPT